MKITAKIMGEDPTLAEKLVSEGIKAKLVKGGIVIELTEINSLTPSFEIPKEIGCAPLFIDIAESGGSTGAKEGTASIVCGTDGSKLLPYYVPYSEGTDNGDHAFFAVPNQVAEVTADRAEKTISIFEHTLVRNENSAKIVTKMIWTGFRSLLPEIYERFNSAALAADQKCRNFNCTSVRYALDQ